MMKNLIIAIFLLMASMVQAQDVLTPEQQLEKAKQEAKAAQEAYEKAKKAAEQASDAIKKKNSQTGANAQPKKSSGWTIPSSSTFTNKQSTSKNNESAQKPTYPNNFKEDPKYLEGAVPEDADKKVVFTLDLNVPNKSGQEIYDIAYKYLDDLAHQENQIQSRVLLTNTDEKIIVARYSEWLAFSRSFLSLDQTQFNYTLIATCSDNHFQLTLSRIYYLYEQGRPSHMEISAENWITDKLALTKKKNDLKNGSSKFRRKTIDRKDEIFEQISTLLKQ